MLTPTKLELANTLTYNEKDALAKTNEFESLHRAMQTDIVNQVIRRLVAIKPAQLVAPVPASAPYRPRHLPCLQTTRHQPPLADSPMQLRLTSSEPTCKKRARPSNPSTHCMAMRPC